MSSRLMIVPRVRRRRPGARHGPSGAACGQLLQPGGAHRSHPRALRFAAVPLDV